jgi:hypothetical protein
MRGVVANEILVSLRNENGLAAKYHYENAIWWLDNLYLHSKKKKDYKWCNQCSRLVTLLKNRIDKRQGVET